MNSLIGLGLNSVQNSHFAALFLDASLKSFAILAVACGVSFGWHRASAATRHLIWFLAVASLPFLPLLSSLLPSWQRPLWSISTGLNSGNQVALVLEVALIGKSEASARETQTRPMATGISTGHTPSGGRRLAAHFSTNWLLFAFAFWSGGVVLMLLSIMVGQLRLRKVSRKALPLLDADWTFLMKEACETLSLGRAVILLQSTDNLMPLTWGWWQPVVLLPAEAGQWPAERRRVVLLHELAHVKRRDCLTQTIARIACALYWFNPLVWLAARRMCVEREHACDDLVLNGGCKASDYAGHLIEIARNVRRIPQVAGIAMARSSGLERRVTAILDDHRSRNRITRIAAVVVVLAVFSLEFLVGSYARENVSESWSFDRSPAAGQLKHFVAEKKAQAEAACKSEGKELLPEFQSMFAAAEKGDWLTISNVFEGLRRRAPQYEHAPPDDARLHGIAWEAVKEVWGAFYSFGVSGEKYSIAWSRDIIDTIPKGSIYFGGTDPGRFLITAMSKSQVNADPFFTLTQNAFADSSYLDYLRSMYGGKIYIPTAADSQKCFQDYLADASTRLEHDKRFPNEPKQIKPGEDVKMVNDENGPQRVQLSGQVAVMSINGLLAKMIFDKHPAREFYLEESFPLDWMYPYLEPHRLIMKINRQPVSELSDDVVRADHDYWTKYVEPMMGDWLTDATPVQQIAAFAEKVYVQHDLSGFRGDPQFVQSNDAHKMFSKLRSSIGGIYMWRMEHAASEPEKARMAHEADFAFRQAWALCPYSTEAVFRYVKFLVNQSRRADALLIAQTAMKFPSPLIGDGEVAQFRNLAEQLEKMPQTK